ncbi:MAG: phosphomannose isomerase type II C-terminal cupin domain [Deltaproteobacteria bacterium]|nr:phosphomannose isomerase type II C-terminal cupin domain [Deltaproteobacteria bacterium]
MKKTEQGSPPWGRWMVLDEGKNYKVKRIEVYPGKRLSYQKHFKRQEHWRIVQGQGKVTLDGQEILVKEWDGVEIPVEAAHRIENTGMKPLIFIEVQWGQYLQEDDIIRLDDDYGRVG